MSEFLEFARLALGQFFGGPGPTENNLVRFGLAALLWAVLLAIAWSRQRQDRLPRERWLMWGFGIAMLRELFMFSHVSWEIISGAEHQAGCFISEPLEHALTVVAAVTVAGAFIHYLRPDNAVHRRYLQLGLGAAAASYLVTFLWWPGYINAHPGVTFHQTWGAWLFHIAASVMLVAAMVLLARAEGWLRNTVLLALSFLFLGEFLTLVNYATDKAFSATICPVGNAFHTLAIPLFGYVYIRELFHERQVAEQSLKTYRNHLEDLVAARTDDLTRVNQSLQAEILERRRAKAALEKLSRHHQLILDSAGEGIFGVDRAGKHTFVNPAAAQMLGFAVEELIGRPSHATWHHSKPDGSPYPEEDCPLHAGYKAGRQLRGDDQLFWRRNGAAFPVRYATTPIYEDGELMGAVIVFQDITERKQAEAELFRRNADLATQNAIVAAVSQSLELDTILNTALDQTLAALDMDVGAVFLLDPADRTLTMSAVRGGQLVNRKIPWPSPEQDPGKDITRQAIVNMRPVYLDFSNGSEDCSALFITSENLATLVSTPLISQNRALGALTLGSKQQNALLPEDITLLTAIGQQIGVAVENARLHARAKQLTALEERQRIATEMHDGLAQTLSYLGYNVDRATLFVKDYKSDLALSELGLIRNTLDRACKEVRQSISSLQADPLPRQSLQESLAGLAAEFNQQPGPPVDLECEPPAPLFVAPEQLQQVLPLVRESLLNARRHAAARQISLRLSRCETGVTISITDDGRGFDPALPPATDGHFGLKIMRARAARLGGQLDVVSRPGQGTCVTLGWRPNTDPQGLQPPYHSALTTAITPSGKKQ
ncbi:MAG: hypothetical protein Kow0031_35030 [Anaerolineae bacterium]